MSSSRPRERRGHRFCVGSPVAGRVRHGVDTEGSSPASATDRARVLVFGGPWDPDHDAIMRIEGEAPGRRFHSSPRCNAHVAGRVTAASVSSLRASATIILLRVAPRASTVRARYHCAGALSPDRRQLEPDLSSPRNSGLAWERRDGKLIGGCPEAKNIVEPFDQ